MDIGLYIAENRQRRHLKQCDLAKMVGVHTTAIGRWERGEQTPTFDKAQDIVKALGGELIIRERI